MPALGQQLGNLIMKLRHWNTFVFIFTLFAAAACDEPAPIGVGFVGGLSGRVADLGISGRNGVVLAIEEQNKNGGINGRKIQLHVMDDKQDPETVKTAVGELIDKKVSAIIGPMTSAMAVVAVPLINEAGVVMVSPTVTTKLLTGRDDYFFRVIAHTKAYANRSAIYHRQKLGLSRIAAIYDIRNRAYTESWLEDFQETFQGLGGKIVSKVSFWSGRDRDFRNLARRALDGGADGVLVISNSVDAALLIQRIREINSSVNLITAEWAATERLVELGGKATEGIHAAQFIDRDSVAPSFIAFRRAYVDRFGEEPGFAGMAGYDAAKLTIKALEGSDAKGGEALRQTILNIGRFPGVQDTIIIDRFGEANRTTFITTVRDGKFKVVRE